MPKYRIEYDGKTYEVVADDQETALAALGMGDQTTMSEDIQGAGTKVLDGLLLGYGDEAAAGLRAGIDQGVATLFGKEASLYGGDFSKAYENLVANQRDVEARFAEQNPGLALGAELVGAVPGAFLTGGLAIGGATRGANALRGAALGGVEGGTYALGEKEGTLGERVEDLGAGDALITGIGMAAGGLGGSLVRGLSPESATLGELASKSADNLMNATTATVGKTADVGKDIANVAYKAFESVSPQGATAAKNMLGNVSDVATENFGDLLKAARPAAAEVGQKFDKLFQPVRSYATNRVSKTFGGRLERGAINGQRVTNKVDQLFTDTGAFKVRDAIEGNDRMMAAVADYGNATLTDTQRGVAINVLRKELEPDTFKSLMKFYKEQESILDDIATGTQSVKRTKGYTSIAAKGKKDMATESLEAERKASERNAKLTTSDATAKDKLQLARLSDDGSTLSKYGAGSEINNPIDSHHYWMRSHGMVNEMNKALGIRGARTVEELAEVAKGGFYQGQLKANLKALGKSDKVVDDAAEMYNQVVYGSQRGMSKELQAIRNVGYASAIGNPYGALLQFHDIANGAWMNGSDEMIKALGKKNGFNLSTADAGIAQQIHGEIVNASRKADGSFSESAFADWAASRSQKLVDFSMDKSGFRGLDGWAKGKIMSSSLGRELSDVTKDAAKWRNKWKYTFDGDELKELEAALKAKDTSNDLVKQLALLNLSKLQPISPASSTLTQLSVPNARILYMLKGFAMTQLDLIRNRIGGKLRSKNPADRKEAMKDFMAYTMLSGGGYGVVNETRQLAKLESPDYGNVPALAFYQMMSIPTLGAFGGNQYGASLFADNPVGAILDNFIPAVPIVEGIGKDISGAVQGKSLFPWETLKSSPLIGPVARGIENLFE